VLVVPISLSTGYSRQITGRTAGNGIADKFYFLSGRRDRREQLPASYTCKLNIPNTRLRILANGKGMYALLQTPRCFDGIFPAVGFHATELFPVNYYFQVIMFFAIKDFIIYQDVAGSSAEPRFDVYARRPEPRQFRIGVINPPGVPEIWMIGFKKVQAVCRGGGCVQQQ
jgi:hypothetical protein